MKIKSIDSFVVRIPFDEGTPHLSAGIPPIKQGAHPALMPDHPGIVTSEYPPIWRTKAVYTDTIEAVIVRIETDKGIVGWGEAHTPVAGEITKSVIDQLLAPIIFDTDPRDIAVLWEKMYASMRIRSQTTGYQLEAISAIDIALWDILGKSVNAPICKLLGGKIRDRIPVYASCLPSVPVSAGESAIAKLVSTAQSIVEQGFRAFKVKLGIEINHDRHVLEQLRNAVGDQIGIAVYANGAYDLPLARQAGKMMENFNVLWLEDPLNPENMRDYTRLASFLDLPVAGGGSLCNRWLFNDFMAAGAFDLIQPDVSRAGGITECRRIAMLADTYGLPFAPHISRGTGIYMAASLQWAAASPNLMTCEFPLDQDIAINGILNAPFTLDKSYIQVSDQAGLGIEVNEDALLKWAV